MDNCTRCRHPYEAHDQGRFCTANGGWGAYYNYEDNDAPKGAITLRMADETDTNVVMR
jgi:hypothetical protein